MTERPCVEIVRIRPKDGAIPRLQELRPRILEEIEARYPGSASTQLFELEDGSWVDVWSWMSRADAEDAIANPAQFPSFVEWLDLVEPVGFDWARPLAV